MDRTVGGVYSLYSGCVLFIFPVSLAQLIIGLNRDSDHGRAVISCLLSAGVVSISNFNSP